MAVLRIHTWTGRKRSNTAADAAASALQSDASVIDAMVNLIPRERHKKIASAAYDVRAAFKQHTLPWMLDSARLLPLNKVDEHRAAMQKAITAYDQVIDEFINDYDQIVSAQRAKLGALASAVRYPDKRTLRDRYAVRHIITPVAVPDELAGVLPNSQELAEQARRVMEDSLRGALQESLDTVRTALTRLADYARGDKSRLHESVVATCRGLSDYVQAVATLLPDGDVRDAYAQLARQLAVLSRLKAEAVRSSATVKEAVLAVDTSVQKKLAELDAALGR